MTTPCICLNMSYKAFASSSTTYDVWAIVASRNHKGVPTDMKAAARWLEHSRDKKKMPGTLLWRT